MSIVSVQRIPSILPKRRDIACRQAGQEALMRDPISGKVHFLNQTASTVWECCDGATSLELCAQRLKEKFDIPAETDIIADIRETIAHFGEQGLLEETHGGL